MMLVAMVLTVLCATTAYGQRIYQAEIDASFFKAWTSCEPGATEVANPDPIDVTDENPDGAPFRCDNNLYKEVGDWTAIYGSSAAYYLWYADLTGTQKIYFKGTPGFKFWVQFNRQAPTEGGDAHGGNMDQTELTIGEDGTVSYDCSSLEYVHLNCIKTKGSGIKGRLTAIVIEGTVKPVSGFMTMIGNGDAEGDDVSSFPVSWDGPNNGGKAEDKPEIVDGGVDGKCFKVKAFGTDDVAPSESWHTQFYIKSDEVLPKGTKWILKMSMKADQDNVKITTSAQAQPRTWKGGMGIEDFYVGKEWQDFTWSGEIGVDDFQSIAIDLNNGDEEVPNTAGNGTAMVSRGITFYFDNIEFGVDLGSANPASDITGAFGGDVIEVSLSGTNIPALVRAADGKKVVLPNDCVEISWNGKAGHPISVEGRPNGNLYIFMLDVDGDEDYFYNDMANDVVKIAFKNPADEACRLLFTDGKWEGEPVPDFSGLVCAYNEELADGTYQSYIWGAAELESIEPEAGSFNLGADVNTFTLTFNQKVEVATVNATLGKEKLTASAADEFSNVITLTRTATTALNGENALTVTSAKTDRGYDLDNAIVVNYSFGLIDVTSAGELEVLVDPALFQNCANDQIPVGYYMNYNGEERTNGTGYSGGARMFEFGAGGDFTKGLYFREGYLLYGTMDEYPLTLVAGKPYTITFNSAQWKDNGVWMKFDIFTKEAYESEDKPLYTEMIKNTPNVNGSKNAVSGSTSTSISFTPDADGDYVLRWTATNENGDQAYSEVLLGNPSMKFIPNLRGLEETLALNDAMEAAKAMREAKNDPRYAGTAYTTLDNLITEYDGKTLTAPSVFAKVTEDLKKATKAMNDHADLCDAYDALPSKAFDLYESKKGTKFEPTEYFQNLAAAVNKYCTFAEETIVNEETGEEHTAEVLQEFVVLYEDDALTAAKNELNSVIDQASKMLSEGQSHNWYGGGDRTYGYAALHERLRRGVELLKKLGVEEDANVIQAANAELGDNDEIAEAIMRHATSLIMGDLASGNSQLFAADEESEEVPSYDLTCFLKNPNIYSPANSTDLPGWVAVRGNVVPFPGWGAEHSVNTAYAEDCQIHAGWHPGGYPMVQQTIENLPAGIYTIHIDCSDNGASPMSDGTYGYIKLSDTPDYNDEEGDLDPELHFAGYVQNAGDIEDVEITDGQLTIGFCFGPNSQAFINEATITLTAPATGYDYADAYKQIVDGVETAKTAKVRSIAVFDLNGRRVVKANKGINIVKKVMSDGTVKTQKVVK